MINMIVFYVHPNSRYTNNMLVYSMSYYAMGSAKYSHHGQIISRLEHSGIAWLTVLYFCLFMGLNYLACNYWYNVLLDLPLIVLNCCQGFNHDVLHMLLNLHNSKNPNRF